MPSEKNILATFGLKDLQAASRKLGAEATDRRRKDDLIKGLLKGRSRSLEDVLSVFASAALKEACEALEAAPQSRGKAGYIAALVAQAPAKKAAVPRPKKAAAPPKAAKVAPVKAPAKAVKPAAPKLSAHEGTAPKTPQDKGAPKTRPLAKARAAKAQKAGRAPKEAQGQDLTSFKTPAATAVVAPEPQEPMAPAAAEASKKPAPRRGPISWSEAAQMAANRGQSAATMLRAEVPQAVGLAQHTCQKCHKAVTVQACQVQACNNYYVAAPGRKICSECLFERNTISMDDFNDRLQEERQCTHCGVPMTHLASHNA